MDARSRTLRRVLVHSWQWSARGGRECSGHVRAATEGDPSSGNLRRRRLRRSLPRARARGRSRMGSSVTRGPGRARALEHAVESQRARADPRPPFSATRRPHACSAVHRVRMCRSSSQLSGPREDDHLHAMGPLHMAGVSSGGWTRSRDSAACSNPANRALDEFATDPHARAQQLDQRRGSCHRPGSPPSARCMWRISPCVRLF